MAWLRGARFCSRRWTASRRASAWSASSRAGGRAVRLRGAGRGPGLRGPGVGGALHTALSEHARVLGKTEPSSKWGRRTAAPSPSSRSGATARSSGKRRSRWSSGRWSLLPLRRLTGVEIQSWEERPDLLPAMFELYREANADIPGLDAEAEMSFEDWRVRELERPARRHDLSFVAVAGDEPRRAGDARHLPGRRFPWAHGGGARLAATRRGGAEARPDRRCEGCGARAALHGERGAKRADAPPERAARLPADSRHGGHARAPRFLGDLGLSATICLLGATWFRRGRFSGRAASRGPR